MSFTNRLKLKKFLVTILVCLIITPVLPAQESLEESNGRTDREEETLIIDESRKKQKPPVSFSYFPGDHAAIYTSLGRVDFGDLLVLGGLGAITWLMIKNDEGIYKNIKEFQANNPLVDRWSPFFSELCQGWSWLAALAFLPAGWISGSKYTVDTGVLAIQAMLHSFVVIQLVKHLTGRQRPSWDHGRDEWFGPSAFFKRYEEGQWARYDAFASGHTITIWSLATVVASRHGKGILLPALCYSVAGLAGMATITEDLHWISDVFIAAVAGYAIGRLVLSRHRERNNAFSFSPYLGRNGGFGISLSLVF